MPVDACDVRIRDICIHLSRTGSGSQVLFLHGESGALECQRFVEALSKTHEVLLPDHPGFGKSDDPDWIRNVPDVAMFYLDFLDALKIARIDVVGHSLGGWIAAEMAIRDCAKLRSITLLAPAGIRLKGVPCGDNFIWGPEESVRSLYHDQLFADRILSMKPSDEGIAVATKNHYTVTKLGWQPRWFNPDLEKWLHRVKVPTHIVWGEEDRLFPPAYAALWQQRLPCASLTMVENCGHLPHVEKTDVVSRHIIEFINALPA
jgi:pimeloyl-ACP methyl ester carboxylesterase